MSTKTLRARRASGVLILSLCAINACTYSYILAEMFGR